MSSPSPTRAIILQRNWSDRKGKNQESGCLATVKTVLSAHWDNAREIRWPGSSECRMKAPWKYSVIPATLDSAYIMRLLMEVNTKSAWLCRGYRNMSLCSAPGRSSRRYPRCSCGRVTWGKRDWTHGRGALQLGVTPREVLLEWRGVVGTG